ncbi:MAG: hypothetical protein LR011_08645, partial [Verrucomicrobia bacterium]|nr:hypothetical protein [Verrucomicrobiota bacterium]
QSPEKIFYLKPRYRTGPFRTPNYVSKGHLTYQHPDRQGPSDLEYLLKHKPQGVNLLRLQAYYDSIFGQP